MRRIAFVAAPEDKERLLDAVLPLLPAGVREREQPDGTVEISSVGAELPPRERLERAAGGELSGWRSQEVPADWRARRALFGTGYEIGERLVVRSPWDAAPEDPEVIDIVVERAGSAFGSGSHPTTRMCLELLLALEPGGGAAVDLGCGIGVLALAAARLGWAPVTGVDRTPEAIEAAVENGRRNGVEVTWEIADLLTADVPVAELVLANAPPPVQLRAATALDERVRHLIVSGIALHEAPSVVEAYGSVGFADVLTLEDDAWAAIRFDRRD